MLNISSELEKLLIVLEQGKESGDCIRQDDVIEMLNVDSL